MSSCVEYHANIQLYVDGELGAEEQEELLSHTASCSPCKITLSEVQALSFLIRASRPDVVAPDSLREAVLQEIQAAQSVEKKLLKLTPRRKSASLGFWLLTSLAASLIFFASSAFFSYQYRQNPSEVEARMVQTAVFAHGELEKNALPLDISSGSSQTVAAWFSRRLPFPLRMANSGIADDARAKYKLVGGRLLSVNNQPVAFLAFSLPHAMASLLIGPGDLMRASGGTIIESDGITMHGNDQGAFHVVTWNNQGLSYVLIFNKEMQNSSKCNACHEESTGGHQANGSSALLDGFLHF